MRSTAVAAHSLLAASIALGATSINARADCDPRFFMVKEVKDIQQSGETELAFVLTATEDEFNHAKTNAGASGAYGLISGSANYGEAQEKARRIAQSTKFDYKSSYASSYLSQTLSPKALDAYVACLQNDKEKPGLTVWLQSRQGDYFTFRAFWVGKDTTLPAAKYDADPIIAGGKVVSKPDAWIKSTTEEIVVKRDSNEDLFLNLKVGGQVKSQVIVKDPPAVVWNKQLVSSKKSLNPASHGPDPGCSGETQNDCIYPLHPGGSFVAKTRTTNHSSNLPGSYSESFTVDRADQICVAMTQSTGSCQITGSAKGQLEAVETFPQAAE